MYFAFELKSRIVNIFQWPLLWYYRVICFLIMIDMFAVIIEYTLDHFRFISILYDQVYYYKIILLLFYSIDTSNSSIYAICICLQVSIYRKFFLRNDYSFSAQLDSMMCWIVIPCGFFFPVYFHQVYFCMISCWKFVRL